MESTVWLEIAKLIIPALLGGVVTYFFTSRTGARKKVLRFDVTGTLPLGGAPKELDLQIKFQGEEYQFLQMSVIELANVGTEFVDNIEIYISQEDPEKADWFVHLGHDDAGDAPQCAASKKDGYLRIEIDHLNSGETDNLILFSRYRINPRITCRTKGVKLIDQRERRARALKFAATVGKLKVGI